MQIKGLKTQTVGCEQLLETGKAGQGIPLTTEAPWEQSTDNLTLAPKAQFRLLTSRNMW